MGDWLAAMKAANLATDRTIDFLKTQFKADMAVVKKAKKREKAATKTTK